MQRNATSIAVLLALLSLVGGCATSGHYIDGPPKEQVTWDGERRVEPSKIWVQDGPKTVGGAVLNTWDAIGYAVPPLYIINTAVRAAAKAATSEE